MSIVGERAPEEGVTCIHPRKAGNSNVPSVWNREFQRRGRVCGVQSSSALASALVGLPSCRCLPGWMGKGLARPECMTSSLNAVGFSKYLFWDLG